MGEKSHRAATSGPVFHPDNALRAQRGTEAMDHFHWPSQFCTLGPFLLMCLDGKDAMFMFFSRSVHLARATWLMLRVRKEWSRVELQCGSHLAVLQFHEYPWEERNLLCIPWGLWSFRSTVLNLITWKASCSSLLHPQITCQLLANTRVLRNALVVIPTDFSGLFDWSQLVTWEEKRGCPIAGLWVYVHCPEAGLGTAEWQLCAWSGDSPLEATRHLGGWGGVGGAAGTDAEQTKKHTNKQKSLSYYTESSQSVFIHRQHDHLYIHSMKCTKSAGSVDMNLSKLWEIVKDSEARYAAVHGVTKSHDLATENTHKATKLVHGGYKLDIHKSVVYLCISHEQSKGKLKTHPLKHHQKIWNTSG